MNKEHIQSKPFLKNAIFSSCRIFSANSRAFAKLVKWVGKESLLSRIVLPRFGVFHRFAPYSIPFEWLARKSTSKAGISGASEINGLTKISRYAEQNTIQNLGGSLLYRQVMNKNVENICYRNAVTNNRYIFSIGSFTNDGKKLPEGYLEKSADADSSRIGSNKRATASKPDKLAFLERLKASTSHNDILIRKSEGVSRDKRLKELRLFNKTVKGRAKGRFGASVEESVKESREGSLETSIARSFASDARQEKGNEKPGHYIDLNNNTSPMNDETVYGINRSGKSAILQQESVQQVIKTLAKKNAASQQESNAQLNVLQSQLKDAEQINHQNMSRLQQSLFELKNALSANRMPVSMSASKQTSKPPSFYGRIK